MARKIVRGQGSPKGKKVANKTGGKKAAAEKLIKELQQQGEDDNAPQGLDELIKSIQKEVDDKEKKEEEDKKKMSALVKVITESGDKKEEKVEQEDIDPEVLELLGIEDYEVEMDYEQFRTLLKEFLSVNQEGSLIKGGKEFSSDQINKVRDTFKKSKGKTGKFTAKKKKTVTASGFKGKNKDTSDQGTQVVDKGSLIPNPEQKGSEDLNDEEKIEEIKAEIDEKVKEQLVPLSKTLSEIEKNLEKILETNKDKLDLEKQAARDAAKKEETEGFKDKEAKLEGKEAEAKVKGEAVDKLKPVSSIFDMIGNFFKNVLMGGALLGLIDFITDPGKAFKGLTDFLNSTLIPFINDIIKFYNDIILAPTNWIIDGINAGFNELEFAMKQIQKVIPIPDIKFPDIPNIKVPDVPNIPDGFGLFQKQEGGGEVINLNLPSRSIRRQSTGGGVLNINLPNQPLQKQTMGGSVVNANDLSLFDGGAIDGKSGLTITGMGKDTQLIAAQPGEVMMSKKAVDMYGADNLLAANEMAGGSNKPKFGKIAGFQNGGIVGGAPFDVLIPLDHTKKPGTIPDTPGGNSFVGSNATGAMGKEREGQDPAVRIIAERLRQLGVRTKVYTPEMAGDYQTYDNYIRSMAAKGVNILPIHFDAGIDYNKNSPTYGKQVGTGFMTITGKGDSADAALADPIADVLKAFQAKNPDLGNFKENNQGNLTVNLSGNAPATLIELGVMEYWRKKYGKDFTSTSEFTNFATNIADAIATGVGVNPGSTPQVDLSPSDVDDLSGAPPAPILPPPPGQLGKTKIDVTQIPPPVIQSGGGTSVLPVPTGGQSQTSAASAAQGRVPGFSAEDVSNFDLIVVKSIYNIVG